jgi:glycosyltransferase involved in cell wall biosynthesis
VESGINKKMNILIISSGMPTDNSPKQALDMLKALGEDHHADLLLKYPLKKNNNNILSVYGLWEQYIHTSTSYWKTKIYSLIKKNSNAKSNNKRQYYFFGLDDSKPPINSNRILKKIKKQYDFVLVFFWQGMLTSKTICDLNVKLDVPFLFMAADMFPMTGGCSYFWDCERLEKSCGFCPGINSVTENDSTRENFLYKKEMLQNVNSVFLGNSWMNNYALKTKLFKNINTIYPIINENLFKPRDKEALKKEYNFRDKTLLFFGSVDIHEERKGYKYLRDALQLLLIRRPELLNEIILVVAGVKSELLGLSDYEVHYTGHLSFEDLSLYYSMSDVFLSPTIQDAGPMMLNQALMCGTPAVAFEIGVAIDIINSGTGYLAKYRDSGDFCNGILYLIDKTKNESDLISQECRLQSLERSSYDGFRRQIINVYDKVK